MAWGVEKIIKAVTMKKTGKPSEEIHVMLDVPVRQVQKNGEGESGSTRTYKSRKYHPL